MQELSPLFQYLFLMGAYYIVKLLVSNASAAPLMGRV